MEECPRCQSAIIEHTEHSSMLKCQSCIYYWCWTCGQKKDSMVHRIQLDGSLCHFIYFLYSYKNMFKIIRFVISFIALTLLPYFFYMAANIVITVAVYLHSAESLRKLCLTDYFVVSNKKSVNILVFVLLLPIRLLIAVLIFSFVCTINSIIMIIAIIPYYILLLYLLIMLAKR